MEVLPTTATTNYSTNFNIVCTVHCTEINLYKLSEYHSDVLIYNSIIKDRHTQLILFKLLNSHELADTCVYKFVHHTPMLCLPPATTEDCDGSTAHFTTYKHT